VHAFLIESILTAQKSKAFNLVVKRIEAYNQDLGKIMYHRITYMDRHGDQVPEILSEEILMIK